ncbi:hypothetical protein J0X15_00835 [Roseibium sp. CAU 1637]|uniref:DUF3329 domain-containing protein n=1 Tax=Roseibium limicola TaxID=2816037 RepID=A0A939EJF8_9HYPH|nr:hypothetical protein [Roseibium limicola]MBO0343751.1 hypothetical protein [Roseibium limicola]
MKDSEHPFFRPLWRRIAVVVICAGWASFEFYMGNTTWGWITAAIGGYAIWTFLITYTGPVEPKQERISSPETDTTKPE